jgi:hypothetical protein
VRTVSALGSARGRVSPPTVPWTGLRVPPIPIVPVSASLRQSRWVLRGGARAGRRVVAHLRSLPVILTCVAGTKTQKTVLWAL